MINERIDDLMRDGLKLIQNTDIFVLEWTQCCCLLMPGQGRKTGCWTWVPVMVLFRCLCSLRIQVAHIVLLRFRREARSLPEEMWSLIILRTESVLLRGDIKEASTIFGEASFNVVTSNPPYMNENHGIVNPDSAKAIARHELLCSLDDVIREASRCLKSKGKMYMVHRPNRLVDIFDTMRKYHLEPKRMRLVYPYVNKAANMVLIEAVKGGNSQLIVEEPLIVYKTDGTYTDALLKMYE